MLRRYSPHGLDTIPLASRRVVIGSLPTCDICIRASDVATVHASIELSGGIFWLKDHSLTGVTRVNGMNVVGQTSRSRESSLIVKTEKLPQLVNRQTSNTRRASGRSNDHSADSYSSTNESPPTSGETKRSNRSVGNSLLQRVVRLQSELISRDEKIKELLLAREESTQMATEVRRKESEDRRTKLPQVTSLNNLFRSPSKTFEVFAYRAVIGSISTELHNFNERTLSQPQKDYSDVFLSMSRALDIPISMRMKDIEKRCEDYLFDNDFDDATLSRLGAFLKEDRREKVVGLWAELEVILPLVRDAASMARDSIRTCNVFTQWSRKFGDAIRKSSITSKIMLEAVESLKTDFVDAQMSRHWILPSLAPVLRLAAKELENKEKLLVSVPASKRKELLETSEDLLQLSQSADSDDLDDVETAVRNLKSASKKLEAKLAENGRIEARKQSVFSIDITEDDVAEERKKTPTPLAKKSSQVMNIGDQEDWENRMKSIINEFPSLQKQDDDTSKEQLVTIKSNVLEDLLQVAQSLIDQKNQEAEVRSKRSVLEVVSKQESQVGSTPETSESGEKHNDEVVNPLTTSSIDFTNQASQEKDHGENSEAVDQSLTSSQDLPEHDSESKTSAGESEAQQEDHEEKSKAMNVTSLQHLSKQDSGSKMITGTLESQQKSQEGASETMQKSVTSSQAVPEHDSKIENTPETSGAEEKNREGHQSMTSSIVHKKESEEKTTPREPESHEKDNGEQIEPIGRPESSTTCHSEESESGTTGASESHRKEPGNENEVIEASSVDNSEDSAPSEVKSPFSSDHRANDATKDSESSHGQPITDTDSGIIADREDIQSTPGHMWLPKLTVEPSSQPESARNQEVAPSEKNPEQTVVREEVETSPTTSEKNPEHEEEVEKRVKTPLLTSSEQNSERTTSTPPSEQNSDNDEESVPTKNGSSFSMMSSEQSADKTEETPSMRTEQASPDKNTDMPSSTHSSFVRNEDSDDEIENPSTDEDEASDREARSPNSEKEDSDKEREEDTPSANDNPDDSGSEKGESARSEHESDRMKDEESSMMSEHNHEPDDQEDRQQTAREIDPKTKMEIVRDLMVGRAAEKEPDTITSSEVEQSSSNDDEVVSDLLERQNSNEQASLHEKIKRLEESSEQLKNLKGPPGIADLKVHSYHLLSHLNTATKTKVVYQNPHWYETSFPKRSQTTVPKKKKSRSTHTSQSAPPRPRFNLY